MSQTTTQLDLQFLTSADKKRTLAIKNPKLNLSQEIVEGAMDQIVVQSMFEKEGELLYNKVRGARYVTRTIDKLFENESPTE